MSKRLLSGIVRAACGFPANCMNSTSVGPHRHSLLACLAFLVVSASPGTAQEQRFITIGTAGVTGVYFPTGAAICTLVNQNRAKHGVRCAFEPTRGSISNIDRLRAGKLDFGFVQSDWQYHAFHGSVRFLEDGPFEDLRSVFSLHSETATFVVRKESGYHSFDALKGAKINVGSEGSGSAASWNALVKRLGWLEDDQKGVSNLKTSKLAEALCSGEIDGYFELIGHPANLVEETQQLCEIRLLGIEGKAIDSLLEEAPYYLKVTVPADDYGMPESVASYGAVATFVTSANMPDEIVHALVSSVFDNLEGFKQLHPALQNLSASEMASRGMEAPLHPGALKFYREQGLLPAAE
ncbi:TAXI family TRAP transporter solute-binding subunit [Roseibium sp.]|uniref:TAXI family TRAP transporter solute-binding subunit n=1 Tax=Roseibium sp. TaxID=1936156 RepID=UPI003D1317C5